MLFHLLFSALLSCSDRLIVDDPWPYAKDASVELINNYELTLNKEIERELDFRLKVGMLTDEERERYLKTRQ